MRIPRASEKKELLFEAVSFLSSSISYLVFLTFRGNFLNFHQNVELA